MILGVSLHALTDFGDDRRPFEQALALARATGVECVMLLSRPGAPGVRFGEHCPTTIIDLAESDPEAVLWSIARAGLWPALLHVGPVDVSSEEAAARSLPLLRTHAALAVRLGVGILGHSVGAAPAPGLPTAQKATAIERLAALTTAVAAEYNLRTAADVHVGGVLETIDDCRYYRAVAEDPRVGLILNIGHMTTAGQPGWELLRERGSRVFVIGWKDHVIGGGTVVRSVELGQGHSPFDRYVDALKTCKRRPLSVIAFENVSYSERPAALARSVHYLREVWRRAGLV